MLARIPLVSKKEDFLAFSRAGRELAELHLHYDDAVPYSGVEVTDSLDSSNRVEKILYGRTPISTKDGKTVAKIDRTRIRLIGPAHSEIVISGIPERAHEYHLYGRSAMNWVVGRWVPKIDKASGIVNDPNAWVAEHGNPRYILDLLLRVITVSLKTLEIVENLPRFEC